MRSSLWGPAVVRASVLCLLALLGGEGARAASGESPRTHRLLDRSLREGIRVSVKGEMVAEGVLRADEIEVRKEPDDDQELRGQIGGVDPMGRSFSLLGIRVQVEPKTRFTREPDQPAAFEELQPGVRVKVDGERREDGTFMADKVRIRRNQQYRERRVVGSIERVLPSSRGLAELVVVGLHVVVDGATGLVGARGRTRPVVRRRLGIVDDDDLQFTNRRRLGKRVAMAGEIRLRGEANSDLDLDRKENDREIVPEVTGIVGFAADFGAMFAYAEVLGEQEYFIEGDDQFRKSDIRLGEVYFAVPVFAPWLSVAVGRQKFNEEREWHYNTKNLDAVRLLADFHAFSVEASVSRNIFDESRNLRNQDLVNLIVQARYSLTDELELEGYYIDRDDQTELGDSPRITGLRLFGDPGRHFEFWIDLAREGGTVCTLTKLECPSGEPCDDVDKVPVDGGRPCGRLGFGGTSMPLVRDVRAHAFDAGVTYRPRIALDPTFTAAYAFGSGEEDGLEEQLTETARSFRQSGLQRNRDKYNGVVSFRYYGEVLDPELTNLGISTVGFGIRPTRGFSVDLLYHGYRQDRSSKRFHVLEIDEEPSGLDPDIGDEWNLALGYEPGRRFELRLTAGVFRPGGAFDSDSPSASTLRFQSKFRF